ncbi:MAG: hypothetical protein B1H04_03115 [Planctomycetales bacterium 4484_123]|nr:MAG: hypothetical protein B1H04_03115 [Planctomycetales bacterium 4484_123]
MSIHAGPAAGRQAKARWAPLLAALLWAGTAMTTQAAEFVWWEGERPARTNFPARTWFSTAAIAGKQELLSGGAWLTSSGKRGPEELFAVYRISMPHTGTYDLWARKFWKHGPFRWRLDKGPWRTCGRDIALADHVEIRTHVCVNWVHLGKVRLTKGPHQFELRLLASQGQNATACFDCFLLIKGPFVPRGKLKPSQRWDRAEEGFFPFDPALDHFGPEALLDLRSLNEKHAGQSGFVRRDGERFLLGTGEPVRFWAVNVSAGNAAQDRAAVDYLARKLAKLGVNMVRYHSPLFDPRDPARLDAKRLDDLHYLIAAMKAQGIYTTVSFYFPLWLRADADLHLPGFEQLKNKRPFALLFFAPRMQQIYRSWARQLLTTVNPHTHLPIAKDPAVAIVEIVNEDSYFFWTFSRRNIPRQYWRRLEQLFGSYLARRHGSVRQALAAWDGAGHPDDDPAAGLAGLFEAWHMTGRALAKASPAKKRRIAEQVRFLAEHQRRFYESTVRYLREELGYGGLISCSNWKTADAHLLDGLERWSYTAGDVIDRHGYFSGRHTGPGASYSVRPGHSFSSAAAVMRPQRLPIQVHQVAGFPHIISELGWTNPNRFRAEATFLASAYGALQGIDGIYFFAVGSNFLVDASMRKFAVSCPAIAWTFPATALQYRRGDVRRGNPVLVHHMKPRDLWALRGAPAAAAAGLDELRQKDAPQRSAGAGDFDPLSFYVGPVLRDFRPGQDRRAAGLEKLIDREAKTVRSITGQLRWDFARGVVTVDTPRSQGAVGFLGRAGRVQLSDVTIECRNEFASVMVISLDGQPLRKSGKALIQAMTEERPYGFRAAGGKITNLGGPPLCVREIDATVTLKLTPAGPATVTVLDPNGYPTNKAVRSRLGDSRTSLAIQLAPQAIYHVVQR